jgi:hypothetical protein
VSERETGHQESTTPVQQSVVHRFHLINGGEPAYAELLALWRRLGTVLDLRDPVPRLDLPTHLPATLAELVADVSDGEPVAIAAAQSADGGRQAVVRRSHDVLCLSAALTPGSWDRAESEWLTAAGSGRFPALGEARLGSPSPPVRRRTLMTRRCIRTACRPRSRPRTTTAAACAPC